MRPASYPVKHPLKVIAMDILPAGALSAAELNPLLDEAFGAARHLRSAYRLRAGAQPIPELSFAARCRDGSLAGSVQCWPIILVADDVVHDLTLLGPLAVAVSARGADLGGGLMHAALACADENGRDAVLLIGDVSYYGRFGFSAAATRGWVMPGPVERHRLLARLSPAACRRLPRVGRLLAVRDVNAQG